MNASLYTVFRILLCFEGEDNIMTVSIQHYISILISLLIVIGLAISSNRKVKSSEDFSLGGRQMSASKVAGIIIGTLVGGASTIGTAQLAY